MLSLVNIPMSSEQKVLSFHNKAIYFRCLWHLSPLLIYFHWHLIGCHHNEWGIHSCLALSENITLSMNLLIQSSLPPPACFIHLYSAHGASWCLSGKESTCNAGDVGSITGWGKSPGGNGNPLYYSCLDKDKNSIDRRSWRATVHGVTKSHTWMTMHLCTLLTPPCQVSLLP